ncbi:MAG: Maf family protein [Verrucomicrobiota bacterium]|jgi:septum formation protein|nr:Maf family protein [Verrucomicrobiota bacterium]
MLKNPNMVLASGSPRRREFLKQLGYAFEVVCPGMEEKAREGESALDYVQRNACEKAGDVAARVGVARVVVAADTVVVLDGRIMEKPASEASARDMLRSLSGRTHQVVSGFCVRGPDVSGKDRVHTGVVSTDVEFKTLSEEEMAAYIRSGEPMDKAGAYAIQGLASYMVRRIRGSYTNVVGFPLTELVEILETEFGIAPAFHPVG